MYLIIDIGCIECGEESNLVTMVPTRTLALSMCEVLNDKLGWQTGQHHFEAVPAPQELEVEAQYYEVLALLFPNLKRKNPERSEAQISHSTGELK